MADPITLNTAGEIFINSSGEVVEGTGCCCDDCGYCADTGPATYEIAVSGVNPPSTSCFAEADIIYKPSEFADPNSASITLTKASSTGCCDGDDCKWCYTTGAYQLPLYLLGDCTGDDGTYDYRFRYTLIKSGSSQWTMRIDVVDDGDCGLSRWEPFYDVQTATTSCQDAPNFTNDYSSGSFVWGDGSVTIS